jgi:TPR repeat protein
LENQKDFEGMLQVAKFYRSSSVARVNESEASKWQSQGLQGMQQQALSGDISQCASLIQQYDSGKYINIDAQQSAKWKKVKLDTLNKKAESGDQSSMMTLANLYRAGMDVPMSEALSLQWLKKLGERGEYEALQRLSTSPLLSPDEKQQWSNQIVSVLNSQAENGSAYARWSLAMHYFQRPGIENKRKSFEWIKVASDRFLLSSFFSSYTLDIRPSFSPEAMQSMYGSVISKEELAQYSNLYIQETEALIESEGLAYSPLYLDMLAKHFESGKFVQKDLQKAQKYQRQYQNYRLELEAEQTRNKNKSN